VSKTLWTGPLALALLAAQAQQAGIAVAQAVPDAPLPQAPSQTLAQQSIPDAPRPQTTLPAPGSIAPGIGSSSGAATPDDTESTPAATAPAPDTIDTKPPVATQSAQQFDQAPEQGSDKIETIVVRTNFVDVPFTVKDSKGRLVPGLTARDVRVYENGLLQHITNFTVDPFPLSVALVIDQTMPQDTMDKVNTALGAIQGAFAPYDELAVFTYNNGPRMITDFTGSQSARLTEAVRLAKASGRQPLMAGSLSGPLAQTTIINNQQFDPNTAANRNHSSLEQAQPREVHTLNDAILEAAKSLTKAGRGRRRIIFVVSDGKEYGSQAKTKDVIRVLQTNKIAVWGTLVGDSSLPVLGFLDRIHLPLMMRDNVLPTYVNATGGNMDAEVRTGSIEKSFSAIAEEARTQYTLGYYTHQPFIDGKYRKLEIRVLRPNLTVIAKQGYFPAATDVTRPPQPASTESQ
jgi:VWFA-related protein